MGRFQFDASHPYLRGNFKPMRFEGTAPFLEVEGELPADFQGVFYLNGACPQFPPTGRYHWFAGDGKVHGYYFRGDGVVDYVSRWVRTENFELERAAKRALFGNKKYGAQSEIDPSVRHIRPQTANTNIIYHGGRLLALEDGSPPISLDPWTLETHGAYDFEGALQGPMTAHVHHDPESGSMIGFGRQLGGPGSPLMSYQEVNSAGRLIRDDRFEAPYCALLHDFAISTNCAVYPLGPAILDPTRPRRGEPVLQWEPTRPSYLGLFPRAPGGTPRWIPMDPAFVWHTLNAFQEGPRLSVDLVRYRALPRYDEGADVRSVKDPRYAGQLVRWSVDLSGASDVVSEEPLDDLISEFPRVDERVVGRKHRHAYFLCQLDKASESRHWDAAVHLDLARGVRTIYDPGPRCFLSEGCFAPRRGSTEEGDGYYLVPVFDEVRGTSRIELLDGRDFAAGPLVKIHLPFRQNPTFHGNFFSGLTAPEGASG